MGTWGHGDFFLHWDIVTWGHGDVKKILILLYIIMIIIYYNKDNGQNLLPM